MFPDINVWVALTWSGHVHHAAAKGWFAALNEPARLFFCRLTQIGLLRLLSTEAVMGRDEVMNQPAAWAAYDRWIEDERISFVEEPADLDPHFRSLTRLQHPAPKDWVDSYLAAFAQVSGLTVVTFDSALHRKSNHAVLLRKE